MSVSATTVALALQAFTLTWTHSVQKSAIEEDWRVESDGLRVVETRIKGSAAGYDPPSDAVLAGGWWRYDPHLPPQRQVALARSGAVADWRLCTDGLCKPISDYLPASAPRTGPVIIGICPSRD